MTEILKKNNEIKLVEILFYIFPLTFIIGNVALTVNLLLFIITSLFLIKKNQLTFRFQNSYWILIIFFSYLFLLTTIEFQEVFKIYYESLEGYGYDINKPTSPSIKNHPILKSFLLFRFVILIFIIDTLFFHKILNLKKILFSSFLCTSFVSVDVIIQYIVGFDLFGFKSMGGRNPGPFGNEIIAGGYLLKFSFLSFFFIFDFFKNKNFCKPLTIFVITVHAIAMGLAGNRMPFILFLLGCFLIILLVKNLRLVTSFGLIGFISLFFVITKNNESIHDQYLRYFQEINSFAIKSGYKIIDTTKRNLSKSETSSENELNKVGNKVENIINYTLVHKAGGNLDSGHKGIWRSSIQIWKEQPWFGFGLKSFRYKCRGIESRAGNSNIITSIETIDHAHSFDCSNHSHNYYLEFLAETGIVGTSLIVVFFIIILKDSFYYLRKYNKEINSKLILILPISLVLFLEIWPVKSSGSFFSNWSGTGFWLIASLLFANKKEKI